MLEKTGNMKPIIMSLLVKEFAVILIGAFLYLLLILGIDHKESYSGLGYLIIVFAFVKVIFFLAFTVKRIQKNLACCENFYSLLLFIGFVIFLIILSFSLDYLCIYKCKEAAFSGVDIYNSSFLSFFEFLYFSMVTFATVGFGDIAPVSFEARFLVMMEITSSFIMIVFVLSNFEKIKSSFKN